MEQWWLDVFDSRWNGSIFIKTALDDKIKIETAII
jgi:hypothetical protein